MWNLNYDTNEPIYRTETAWQNGRAALWFAKGDGEAGVSRCKLFHVEWISNEVLLCSTGNSIQSVGIEHSGR